MYSMFEGCSSLTSIDLSGWDTSSVRDSSWSTAYMFDGCTSLASVRVGSGYGIKSADMFPDATAADGWWSSADGRWYTKAEIVSGRSGVADTYSSSSEQSAAVRYRTHVQTYGWQGWASEGETSGTAGQSKRLEAVQVELTGDMAGSYDVWYRVHAQTFGWMGWASNGERAGTAGYARRLEAVQILVLPKGSTAPSAGYGGCAQATEEAFAQNG